MEARTDNVDRFSKLPLELKLIIWKHLKDSIKNNYTIQAKEEVKDYSRLILLNKEWFHTFAEEVYRNEFQVSKVLSNNLHNKSPENIQRIENLYTCYMTALERVGYFYHKAYKLFWGCLEKFDYKINFPNLKTLVIATGKHLQSTPLIRLTTKAKVDTIMFYHHGDTPKYPIITEFCDHIHSLNITVGRVILSSRGSYVKLLSYCKPLFNCNVEKYVFNGDISMKELNLLATSKTRTSLSVRNFTKTVKPSPKLESYFQTLTSLELGHQKSLTDVWAIVGSGVGFALQFQPRWRSDFKLANLKTLHVNVVHGQFSEIFELISLTCPALVSLNIKTYDWTEDPVCKEIVLALNSFNDKLAMQLENLELGKLNVSSMEYCASSTRWARYRCLRTIGYFTDDGFPGDLALIRSQNPAIENILVTNLDWTYEGPREMAF